MEKRKVIKGSLFFVLSLFLLLVVLTTNVKADVGVGISPSKMVYEVEGGTELTVDVLVFNTGSEAMDITLVPSSEIADYVTIEPKDQVVEPEPVPHSLPIKNGKAYKLTIKAPSVYSAKKVLGQISATGSPTQGSTFGGSVGVASSLEIDLTPSKSLLSYVTDMSTTQIIIIVVIILLIVLFFVLKKMGLKLSFER